MSLWSPQDVPPYPPIRYTKDQPEASAWVRRGDATPDYETRLANHVKYHYLADQEQTDGDYVLDRLELGPNCGGPAPHLHRTMSEAFSSSQGPSSSTTATSGKTVGATTSCTSRPAAFTAGTTSPTSRPRCWCCSPPALRGLSSSKDSLSSANSPTMSVGRGSPATTPFPSNSGPRIPAEGRLVLPCSPAGGGGQLKGCIPQAFPCLRKPRAGVAPRTRRHAYCAG